MDRREAPREIVSSPPPVIHPPLSTDEPTDKEEERISGWKRRGWRRRLLSGGGRTASSTVGGYRMAERRGLFSIASSYIRGGGEGEREVRVSRFDIQSGTKSCRSP